MQYTQVIPALFQSRPNRFLAEVILPDGSLERVHVKNTGRCKELLVPGARIYLEKSGNPARKTRYDLVAVEKGELLINMDAQAPNRVFREWAEAGHFVPELTLLRPETTWGKSRFDFYWEASGGRRGFVEVKGVTLEDEGRVFFPDAPTERGLKHVEELIAAHGAGYESTLFFVIQMERARWMAPNDRTHQAFGDAVRRAAAAGVQIAAYTCRVTPESLELAAAVPIRLTAERE